MKVCNQVRMGSDGLNAAGETHLFCDSSHLLKRMLMFYHQLLSITYNPLQLSLASLLKHKPPTVLKTLECSSRVIFDHFSPNHLMHAICVPVCAMILCTMLCYFE